MKRTILLISGIILLATTAYADVFVVAGFKHDATNLAARIHQRTDNNDEICALILVNTSILNLKVTASDGVVGSVDFKDGYYWVYLSPGTRQISFYKKGYERLNYDLPQQIKSEETYILTLRYRSTGNSNAGNDMGFVVIDSQPEGADVYINDSVTGMQTPFQNPYHEGYYRFQLKKPFYENYSGNFEIHGSNTSQVGVKLVPEFGTLTVNTKPEIKATVNIDGEDKGVTPDTITMLSPGNHILHVTKEMYFPWQGNIIISKGKNTALTIPMKANFGTVTVNAGEGDVIYIDNQEVGTGNYSGPLLKGTHIIGVEQQHYFTQKRQVAITPGQNLKETFNLRPKTGMLSIMSNPIGADIYINNKLLGQSPKFIESLKEGAYMVKFQKQGYVPIEKQIEVTENKTTLVKETLQNGAEVRITSQPTGAKLYVDGKYDGITPITVSLSLDSHRFKLQKEKYKDCIKTQDITKGKDQFAFQLVPIELNVKSLKVLVLKGSKYGFYSPKAIAFDHQNNVWVASTNSITFIPKGNPDATPIIFNRFRYGFVSIGGIGVDNENNIWVPNTIGKDLVTIIPKGDPGTKPIVFVGTEYVFSGSEAFAVDKQNNIWIVNSVGDLTYFPDGNPKKEQVLWSRKFKYGFDSPRALAIDSHNNIWVANGGNSVTLIPKGDRHAKPVVFKGWKYGFNGPYAIAVDHQNNVWVTNNLGSSVTFIPKGDPDAAPVILKDSKYGFGGSRGIVVDHQNNVWVANGYCLTFIPDGNPDATPVVLKGSKYGFNGADAIAVDHQNNIWVANSDGNSVTILYAGKN